MDWMLLPLKRYADFEGRSRRMEYWMFALFITLVAVAIFAVALAFGGFNMDGQMNSATIGILVLGGLFWLGILVPSIAVTVRRLHDQNLSGWFYLLAFIPYVGGLVIFVFMLIPGTRGENRFGPDPKGFDEPGLEQVFR